MSVDMLEVARLQRSIFELRLATSNVMRTSRQHLTEGELSLMTEASELIQHASLHAIAAVNADSDDGIASAWKVLNRASELATTAMQSAVSRDLVAHNPGMPADEALREATALLDPTAGPHRPMLARRAVRGRA